MPRHVIFTIGETWPSGHKLVGPVKVPENLPVYDKIGAENKIIAYADLVVEDLEVVTYTEVPFYPEVSFISYGIRTEVNSNLEMVDCELYHLFLSPKIES